MFITKNQFGRVLNESLMMTKYLLFISDFTIQLLLIGLENGLLTLICRHYLLQVDAVFVLA